MLTAAAIRDAKPKERTFILWDDRPKGLGCRITPAGSKAYVLDYHVDGTRRRVTLERTTEGALKNARRLAGEQLIRIRSGSDPVAEKQERREAPTMGNAVSEFFETYVLERLRLGKMAPKTVRKYKILWSAHLAGPLGKLKVAEVNRKHIERAVAEKPPTTRNRLIALVSRLFSYFEQQELRPQNTNPVKGIEKARLKPRDSCRLLSCPRWPRNWAGTRAYLLRIRFAALTGLRIGEIHAIRWTDIDLDTGRLTLPDTKTGRRLHTLPAPALDILASIPRKGSWVFTTHGTSPITYRTCRKHFQQVSREANIEGAHLHDLRRGYMTASARAGASAALLQQVLGHKTSVAANAYVRSLGDEVTDMRSKVSAELAELMES